MPREYDPATYGAIYGAVGAAQMTTNLTAFHSARDAAVAAGGGEIVLNGQLWIDGMADLEDLGQTTIAIIGDSMLGSGLYYQSAGALDNVVSLQGTSYCRMENLTINGGIVASVGLYCARDPVTEDPAGKHHFSNVRVVECAEVSHVNYASEENTYIKCQFQRSPVGAIFTAFPLTANAHVVDATPANFAATSYSSIAHHLYDCALGSEAYTTRCGLMVLGSMVKLYGGVVQTAPLAEAAVIIEANNERSMFRDVDVDGNFPIIGYKIGYFTKDEVGYEWLNRMYLSGHITISAVGGTSYLSAYGLVHSTVDGITLNGPADVTVGADLLDTRCRGNLFLCCKHHDNRDLRITSVAPSVPGLSIWDDVVEKISELLAAVLLWPRGAFQVWNPDNKPADTRPGQPRYAVWLND